MPIIDEFGPQARLPGVPIVSGDIPKDIMTGTDRLSMTIRRSKMEKSWQAYNGALPAVLDPDPSGVSDAIRVNLAPFEVDLWTQIIFGRNLEISFENDPGEIFSALVNDAWPMSKRMAHLQRARLNGGVTGHAFTRVMPPDKGEAFPRVIVPESQKMWFSTDPDDYERIISYTFEWLEEPKVKGGKVMRHRQVHQRIDTPFDDNTMRTTWLIIESEAVNTPDARFREIERIGWDFERSQFSDAPNIMSAGAWGQSDLDQGALEIQTGVERAYSSAARSGRYNSDPLFVTKMFDAEARKAFDERKAGGGIHLSTPEQSVELLEFEAKGMEAMLALGDRLISLWHKLESLPNEEELTKGGLAPASGVSMEMRLLNTTMRIEALKRTYGSLITDTCKNIGMEAGLPKEVWDQEAICAWQGILDQAPDPAPDPTGPALGPDGQPLPTDTPAANPTAGSVLDRIKSRRAGAQAQPPAGNMGDQGATGGTTQPPAPQK